MVPSNSPNYVKHPLIKPNSVEMRLYQEVLVSRIVERGNTLVVAPTALGKTIVAVMLAAHQLKEQPESKILFMSPTKPLTVQHSKSFKKFMEIDEEKIQAVTGTLSPKKRKEAYKQAQIITATPQTIESDLLNGRISLKDFSLVIYDECLKGDTKVLLNNGLEKPIKEVVKDFFLGKDIFVKSFDTKKQFFVSKKVTNAQKIPCLKQMIKVETASKKIIATEDHPFLVKRGRSYQWIKAADLTLNDYLSVCPKAKITSKPKILIEEKDILKFYSKDQQKNIETYYKSIGLRNKFEQGHRKIGKKLKYSERQVSNWIYSSIKPKPLKLVNSMEELGLLPFSTNNPYINIIARLLGHIYGDGWITQSAKGYYIIGFSGDIKDLERIQEDLKTIGLKYSKIQSRTTKSKIKGRTFKGRTNSFTCSDLRLTRLLVSLGAPVGNKTKQPFLVPKWITDSNKEIKKEFLSSLFGGDACNIKNKPNTRTFYSFRFSLNKANQYKREGKKYLNQLKKILKEFDVETLKISEAPGNNRKDGIETIKLILTLSNSTRNMINFLSQISYTYALKKEKNAKKILGYLLLKKDDINTKNLLSVKARLLKKQGFDNFKIAKMLNTPKYKIEKWIYRPYEENNLSKKFPKFNEQAKQETNLTATEQILSIKEAKSEEFVYDLTVEDTHNFIANNIIVHNCHRAIGDYAYVFVNLQLQKQNPSSLVVALTASPGSEEEKIQDVCRNLSINNIEIKEHTDEDVQPYINKIETEWVKVDLPPEFVEIKDSLEEFMKIQLKVLKTLGVAKTENKRFYNRIRLLEMQRGIRQRLNRSGRAYPQLFTAASKCASLLKIAHAEELIETQGIGSLNNYFEKIKLEAAQGKSKAAKAIIADKHIKKAMSLTDELVSKNVQHPKYAELERILVNQFETNPKSKVLVFNHYRDSIKEVVKFLKGTKGIKATKFIGQATKGTEKGMNQKKQQAVLEQLRDGKYNTLIASSVAEEGLDIPAVDLVIFFEPVPSEIRTIQRRGRTGRFGKGKMVVLMARGTRDEAYYWAAKGKENRMKTTLKNMKRSDILPEQSTLSAFTEKAEDKIIIFVDTREQASTVIKELFSMDCVIRTKQLDVGDYIASKDVCIERKTIEDFVSSMIDGRLFTQIVNMRNNYDKPLILLEGDMNEMFTLRNIHKNSIVGALTSIALDYQVPIINTKDSRETAEYVYNISKREQIAKQKEVRLRIGRKGLTTKEQQQFIVEGLPSVGPLMAKSLLKKFKSIKKIASADEKKLQKVDKMGPKKAKQIFKVFNVEYDSKK